MIKKKTGSDYYTNRHSCFLLQYHIVLVTKYRHPVLTGSVKEAVYERIRYVAESRGFNILELNGEADHVHLLIEADPQTSPGELVNVIKTQTSRKARKLYGNTELKPYYWKPYFWNRSYLILSSGGAPIEVIRKYIQDQGENKKKRLSPPEP